MKFCKIIFINTFILPFFISCNQKKNCGSDFNAFIEKFKKDSTFQKQHIDFPMMEYYSDEDFPMDILERMTTEDNYSFIDVENDLPTELRNKDLYDIHINQNQDTIYYQKIGKQNSINITYKFNCTQKTYHLIEIEDLTD
ncbi:hypothetical protein LPB85_06335 [Chryseobacterium sp. LC2016-27]|jgi:hypothetical protein|uniref:hypothetical protein n=1 Tax=Chryseobacterium sp. LC2016-27 TaxID=2897326 RepID=UPI001E430629|nr:hypothetical protein [Chryseobacterium sp. LC2016-27]MCD0455064.1 hypothetical protein [Chryseobacterium sp. LC2016-27]